MKLQRTKQLASVEHLPSLQNFRIMSRKQVQVEKKVRAEVQFSIVPETTNVAREIVSSFFNEEVIDYFIIMNLRSIVYCITAVSTFCSGLLLLMFQRWPALLWKMLPVHYRLNLCCIEVSVGSLSACKNMGSFSILVLTMDFTSITICNFLFLQEYGYDFLLLSAHANFPLTSIYSLATVPKSHCDD